MLIGEARLPSPDFAPALNYVVALKARRNKMISQKENYDDTFLQYGFTNSCNNGVEKKNFLFSR